MHTPVLLQQAIEKLNVKSEGLYIDATFGEGGYSLEIVKKGGKLLAIDIDIDQLKFSEPFFRKKFFSESLFKKTPPPVKFIRGNFADIEKIAKENNFFPVDGVVFDLGLSVRQLDESGRGFSYERVDDPLDMRLNQADKKTAKDILREKSEEELYEIFARYGEDINSEKIARNIVNTRRVLRLEKVADLIKIIDKSLGRVDKKTYARIFQALRIEVNNEFENLKKGLAGAIKILKPDGRIVVITFHSLEDRIVKNFVKTHGLKLLDKKPIKGIRFFERSAKLRIITL